MGTCVVRWVVGLAIVIAASTASAAPELRPGSAVSADVVLCEHSCWLADLIMPDGWVEPKRQIELLGVTGAATGLGTPLPIAASQLTGDMLAEGAVKLGDATINAGTAAYPVSIDKATLSPNHYVGILRVSAPDGSGPIDIPVDLRVRTGPGWPLLMLIFGIAIAWIAKWRKDKGETIERVLKTQSRLTASIAFDSAPARAVLVPMLDRAEDALTRDAIEEVDRILTKIAERRPMLAALDRLARSLPGNTDIARARDMIAREQDEQAKELIAKLEDLASAPSGEEFAVSSAAAARRRARRRVPELTAWQKLKYRVLLPVLGPFLRLLLLLLLALLGLKELYVDGGGDFGARPLYDYLALFFWGFGAEVATRSLDNIGGLLGGRAGKAAAAPENKKDDSGGEGEDDDGDDDAAKPEPKPTPEPEAAPSTEPTVSLPEDEIGEEERPDTPTPFGIDTWPGNKLDIPHLISEGFRGRGVKIAVIDTGVSTQATLDHKRITRLDTRPNFPGDDDNGHGTMMTSLFASERGICPEAHVVSVRALDADGNGSAASLVAGIKLAIQHGCHVISISAGQRNQDSALDAEVAKAVARGIVVVAAIRKENPTGKAYPAASPGAIAIAPSDKSGKLIWGAPPGYVLCAAPGAEIPTFDPSGKRPIDGSSPAAALVAGVCALLLSGTSDAEKPALGKKLAAILKSTSRKVAGGRVIAPKAALEKILEET
jgi:hypothetical protein